MLRKVDSIETEGNRKLAEIQAENDQLRGRVVMLEEQARPHQTDNTERAYRAMKVLV